MEEMKNGTLAAEQEQPVETQQTAETQAEPQFRLTEDGSIDGDFSDWGLTEGEKPESEQPKQEEEQPKYYTKEEIEQLGIDKLDPNRIPPELLPFYKSMQADYTRKTQALAEERKAVERLLDKALSHPELAKEFMGDPELVQLAQKHPELGQKLQAVSQMAQPEQPKNQFELIAEQAKRAVEQELGEEFDEFNPTHMAALAVKVQEIQQQFARQQAVHQKLAELQASEPHFAEIDRYAEQKLSQMPYAEAVKILNAMQTGDIDTLLNFWNQCRQEWYNQNLGQKQETQPQPQPQKLQVATPPPVESAGKGEVETKPAITPHDFAYMSDDEKAQALIKLGLV
jgi:hypothetical protein